VPKREIGNKAYYVTMTDSFMSGWGKAKGKTNKYVIGCDTHKQANTVAKNAKKRSEMKYVNICLNKPRYKKDGYIISYTTYSQLGDIWKR